MLESRTSAVEGDLEQRTKSASSALAGERASFEIERSALLSETASLNSQLEALRKAAAEAEAAGSASQSEIASQLSEARAAAQSEADEARRLREQLEGAASDKREGADALERMTRAHAAKEDEVTRIREQLDDVNSVNAGNAKRHEEELGSLKQKLDEEQQAKATLESEQQAQFEQMQAREQKAASECERMFKLVQQAHTKVQEKEKNFKRQLEQERERFAATLEAEVAQRMEGIQKKYEEEARQRRKLFNIVQELQGNIRVYCRVRPCLADEEHLGVGIEFKGEHDDLIIQNPRDKLAPKRFEFEKTFRTDMGQADVFEAVGPLCCSAMDGYNVCIFAYGQTGSGKTYSMEGTHPFAPWDPDLCPLAERGCDSRDRAGGGPRRVLQRRQCALQHQGRARRVRALRYLREPARDIQRERQGPARERGGARVLGDSARAARGVRARAGGGAGWQRRRGDGGADARQRAPRRGDHQDERGVLALALAALRQRGAHDAPHRGAAAGRAHKVAADAG